MQVNLLALQLEHGVDRSHRILRVLQESHARFELDPSKSISSLILDDRMS